MKTYLTNPKLRLPLALGAALGFGQPLFRGLTENLGPMVGLVVFVPLLAAIVLGMHLVLDAVGKGQSGTESTDMAVTNAAPEDAGQ